MKAIVLSGLLTCNDRQAGARTDQLLSNRCAKLLPSEHSTYAEQQLRHAPQRQHPSHPAAQLLKPIQSDGGSCRIPVLRIPVLSSSFCRTAAPGCAVRPPCCRTSCGGTPGSRSCCASCAGTPALLYGKVSGNMVHEQHDKAAPTMVALAHLPPTLVLVVTPCRHHLPLNHAQAHTIMATVAPPPAPHPKYLFC